MEMTTLALLVLMPLLVWRIYSRLKRMMGRTRSQLWRHWLMALLFPALLVWLGMASRGNVLAVSCLAGAAIAGAWAGVLGIKLTRFETTAKGYFYTPDSRLAMTVAMLFVARLLYRGLELYINSRTAAPQPAPAFMESPLSLMAVGLLSGYFAAYGWGLLRWHRRQRPLHGAG
ncbi:MAG: hypothetical protein V4754_00370 [Pseudomonadota bacterium]